MEVVEQLPNSLTSLLNLVLLGEVDFSAMLILLWTTGKAMLFVDAALGDSVNPKFLSQGLVNLQPSRQQPGLMQFSTGEHAIGVAACGESNGGNAYASISTI